MDDPGLVGMLLVITWVVQAVFNSRYTREIRKLKREIALIRERSAAEA
jgi:hypothetical protein